MEGGRGRWGLAVSVWGDVGSRSDDGAGGAGPWRPAGQVLAFGIRPLGPAVIPQKAIRRAGEGWKTRYGPRAFDVGGS